MRDNGMLSTLLKFFCSWSYYQDQCDQSCYVTFRFHNLLWDVDSKSNLCQTSMAFDLLKKKLKNSFLTFDFLKNLSFNLLNNFGIVSTFWKNVSFNILKFNLMTISLLNGKIIDVGHILKYSKINHIQNCQKDANRGWGGRVVRG